MQFKNKNLINHINHMDSRSANTALHLGAQRNQNHIIKKTSVSTVTQQDVWYITTDRKTKNYEIKVTV